MALSQGFTAHGFPSTILLLGISQLTYEFGAINTLSPIVILPTNVAFIPIQTSLPIVGTPFRVPLLDWPIVAPLWMLMFLPNCAFGLMVMQKGCPKYNPGPILHLGDISR